MTADADSTPATAAGPPWKCCKCCDEEAEPGECGFNRRRDDHGGPCEDCEPEAFDAWLKAQPEWRTSDAPF